SRDYLGRMGHGATVGVGDGDLVQDSLGDHVAIDTIGRQVFHVAVEQAGALAVQYAVAVTNHGAHGRPRSLERPLAHTLGAGSQVLVNVRVRAPRLDLVGVRELVDRDLVLIGMAGPGAVHQTVRLVLLVLFEHLERPRVELHVFTTGIERRHATDRQHAAFVADLGHHLAQVLEKGDIVRDGVAVGKNPRGVVQGEVDQAG